MEPQKPYTTATSNKPNDGNTTYTTSEPSTKKTAGTHPRQATHPRGASILYIAVLLAVFGTLTAVFLFMPRSQYSELEKRELATFPDTKILTQDPAAFTSAVSSWFSDSEPYRDQFMTLSMSLREAIRHPLTTSLEADEQQVVFRPAAPEAPKADADKQPAQDAEEDTVDENAKLASSGTIVVGSGDKVRTLMAYGGGRQAGQSFIKTMEAYTEAFPDKNLYALIAPIATEFYLPAKAKNVSKPQSDPIYFVRDNLPAKVHFVDAYSALAAHKDEDIYLRTDHHWAPLGAFYAARELAKCAGVNFPGLDSYDSHVIHNFVGSMYGYSKDIAVKKAPEDFVYYTPRGLDPQTTYVTYFTDKSYRITSETKPRSGPFFYKFKDGSGNAYLTFMGSDSKLTKVITGTPGNRRLLIIKDSYGNALPGYLFFSFAEVHVIDFRYFNRNLKKYVADNEITDIVVAFNIFNMSGHGPRKVKAFLTQSGGSKQTKDQPTTNKPAATNTTTEPTAQPATGPATQPAGESATKQAEAQTLKADTLK